MNGNEKIVMVKLIEEAKKNIAKETTIYENLLLDFLNRFSKNTNDFEDRVEKMEQIVRDSEEFLQRQHYLNVEYAEVLEALINEEFEDILLKYME